MSIRVEAVHALGLHVVVDEDLTEVQAHVEDDDVLARSDRRHLPTDLFVTAECRNFDFHDLWCRTPWWASITETPQGAVSATFVRASLRPRYGRAVVGSPCPAGVW